MNIIWWTSPSVWKSSVRWLPRETISVSTVADKMKIWRGNAYNERGEEQLCRYLEYFDLKEGYLLSFCFNKTKQSGLLPPVELNGRTLIEAIV